MFWGTTLRRRERTNLTSPHVVYTTTITYSLDAFQVTSHPRHGSRYPLPRSVRPYFQTPPGCKVNRLGNISDWDKSNTTETTYPVFRTVYLKRRRMDSTKCQKQPICTLRVVELLGTNTARKETKTRVWGTQHARWTYTWSDINPKEAKNGGRLPSTMKMRTI